MTIGKSSDRKKEVQKNSKVMTELSFIQKMINKMKGVKKK